MFVWQAKQTSEIVTGFILDYHTRTIASYRIPWRYNWLTFDGLSVMKDENLFSNVLILLPLDSGYIILVSLRRKFFYLCIIVIILRCNLVSRHSRKIWRGRLSSLFVAYQLPDTSFHLLHPDFTGRYRATVKAKLIILCLVPTFLLAIYLMNFIKW